MKWTQRICGWVAFAAAASPLMIQPSMAQAQGFGQPAQQGQAQAGQGQPAAQQRQPGAAAQAAAQVVATVDGEPITQQEVQASLQAQLQGQPVDPATAQQLQQQVVETLIDSRLVEKYVLEKGPDVADQEVEAAVEQLKGQLQAQQVSFDQFLASRGYTQEMLKARIEGSLAWQKFQQQQVAEPKLQQFYQENQQQFQAENFEQARPQVTNAYIGKLWENIVAQMKPNADIQLAGGGGRPASRPAGGAPQPGQAPQR